jgi:hypothetical protein
MAKALAAFLLCVACGGPDAAPPAAQEFPRITPCQPTFTYPPPPPRFCQTDADCHSDEQCGDPAVALYTGVCVPKCIVGH